MPMPANTVRAGTELKLVTIDMNQHVIEVDIQKSAVSRQPIQLKTNYLKTNLLKQIKKTSMNLIQKHIFRMKT